DRFLADQLLSHRLRIDYDPLSEPPRPAIQRALSAAEVMGEVPAACHPDWDASEKCRRNAWDVAVEAIGLYYVRGPLGDHPRQPDQLHRCPGRPELHRGRRASRDAESLELRDQGAGSGVEDLGLNVQARHA